MVQPHEREHGPHTLKVWTGTIVGIHGQDVFVEFGPRTQGVIARSKLSVEPVVGAQMDFTQRGREDGLWILEPADSGVLASWETMEVGSLVQARVVELNAGGAELKIGPLHGFMPKSQSGLARDQKLRLLLGKTLTCEVLEVDDERQRVLLSRKRVLQRERESQHERDVAGVAIGQRVQGRIVRVEAYGAFLRFGRGLEGLIHVSNLSHEHLEHASERVSIGDNVEAIVLHVRQGGKRIGLGLKQLEGNPWRDFARTNPSEQIFEGQIVRVLDFGLVVCVRLGVDGLVHRSQSGLAADVPLRSRFTSGQPVAVRVLELDADRERMSLSLLHSSGARIEPDEVQGLRELEELRSEQHDGPLRESLGRQLRHLRGRLPDKDLDEHRQERRSS